MNLHTQPCEFKKELVTPCNGSIRNYFQGNRNVLDYIYLYIVKHIEIVYLSGSGTTKMLWGYKLSMSLRIYVICHSNIFISYTNSHCIVY